MSFCNILCHGIFQCKSKHCGSKKVGKHRSKERSVGTPLTCSYETFRLVGCRNATCGFPPSLFWRPSRDPSSVSGAAALDRRASAGANAVRQRLGQLSPCILQSKIGDGNKRPRDGQTQSPSVFSLARICQASPCFFSNASI